MKFSGRESFPARKLADWLENGEIPPSDIEGIHSTLLLLCKRVAELTLQVKCLSEPFEARKDDHP